MPCTPYAPVDGNFVKGLTWGMLSSGEWGLRTVERNNAAYVQLLRNGSVVHELLVANADYNRWIFFPGGSYLAVRDVERVGGDDKCHIWLYHLGTTVQVTPVGGYWTVPTGHQLHLQVTSDGLAFYIFCTSATQGMTNQNAIYRSDTVQLLLGPAAVTLSATQIPWGRITTKAGGSRYVQIWPDPDPRPEPKGPILENPLPSGKCVLVPPSLSFQDAIVDSPNPTERARTMSIALKNAGSDCMGVQSVGSQAPFSASAALPTTVGAGQQVNCNVSFAPPASSAGPQRADLPITLAAANAESANTIHCEGNARKSNATCEISQPLPILEAVLGVSNAPRGTCTVTNGVGDSLQINSIQSSPHFKVIAPLPDYSRFLGHNDPLTVTVEFRPTAVSEQPVVENLTITRTPPNGVAEIQCRGTARPPRLAMTTTQPAPFSTYRYRREILTVNVNNSGEVPLALSTTSTVATLRCTNPGTVAPGAAYPLSVEVYSDQLGALTGQVIIHGTFHLQVNGENGAVLIDQMLETTATFTIAGNVEEMPQDRYEPRDSFETAIRVDLPLPSLFGSATKPEPNLTLDDRNGGADKDIFDVTYQSTPVDDNCTGGGTNTLGLGVVMTTYPPKLTISSKAKPELNDAGAPFSQRLEIFRSDTFDRGLVRQTDGTFALECPTLLLTDKRLYAVMSNPAYTAQGPIEYDIDFTYSSMRVEMVSSGRLTDIRYVILKKYYEKIWLVDPPRGVRGERVAAEQFARGEAIVIDDFAAFANSHAAAISQGDLLSSLEKILGKKAGSILAADCLALAQTCAVLGLREPAERLYRQSADAAKAGHEPKLAVTALRGLQKLYEAQGRLDLARASEAEIRKLDLRGRTPTK